MKCFDHDDGDADDDDNDEVCHLIDLHLSEGIVDLGGGELDTEGHEGVPETSVINSMTMMTIMTTMTMMTIIT